MSLGILQQRSLRHTRTSPIKVLKPAGLQTGLRFSPAAFFYGLLPPIVFAAGFTLKKRDFFRNFGTISVFAVPGTFISALFFGSITYSLVAIGIVKRSHLGTAPLIECLLYGKSCVDEALFAQHSFTGARTSHAPIHLHACLLLIVMYAEHLYHVSYLASLAAHTKSLN